MAAEFSDYFPGQVRFTVLPYFIFAIFVILMPILLMNLLVSSGELVVRNPKTWLSANIANSIVTR